MTTPTASSFIRSFGGVGVAFCLVAGLPAEPVRQKFDIPATVAEKSLKVLSLQSGRQVLFPTDAVEGIRTRAIAGEMTAADALRKMLEGTMLVGVEDHKTGSLTVRRQRPATNGSKSTGGAAEAEQRTTNSVKKNIIQTPDNQEAMNRNKLLTRLTAMFTLLAAAPADAQVSPTGASDAATLARYDTNRNGRLDPEELRAMEADMRRAGSGNSNAKADETITLSPFEVVGDTRGYFSANTMSGTRLNTSLEDLASAISVISKDQMLDFAMLDINDVFLYGANTEGTGTYTEYVNDAGNGAIDDVTAGDPANANRVRGIGNANVSLSNFETSNRVPIDPIDADAIEISRGPNANIFGLGNASGTVNIVGATANTRRNRGQVGFRVDSYEGYRTSIDVNRVLMRDKLALRVTAVKQRDAYNLKPSGVDSQRYNGLLQFRPFKKTTLNASYQVYRAHGNRPNSMPPIDGMTDWLNAGAPTWDPVTNSRKLNGVVVSTSNSQPAYFYTGSGNLGNVFVEADGSIALWMAQWGNATDTIVGNFFNANAVNPLQSNRRMVQTRALTWEAQPLIGRRVDMMSDKSIYDWSRINLIAANRITDKTETAKITLDQIFFDTGRQSLAAQFGWFREDSEKHARYLMAAGPTTGPNGQLVVDVNERLLDGRPNPFFMRPLIMQADPRTRRNPLRNDTYRGQFAYKIDFTGHNDVRRWLGAHGLVGYGEYKDKIDRRYVFAEVGRSVRGDWILRPNVLYYVGDNQGLNIDHAPGTFGYGPMTFIWGNAITGQMNHEAVVLGEEAASGSASRSVQKTQGAILQSRFLRDRVVATFGLRDDRHYTKFGNPTRRVENNRYFDYEYMNQWRDEDWQFRDGRTEQRGVVVRPLRGLGFIERPAHHGAGVTRFMASTLRGLSLHYNESDSFKPAAPAQNVYGEWLPDPAGTGKDYGFSFNMLDGKLMVRVNKYRTEQINSRSGPSAGFARGLWGLDHTNNNLALEKMATEWITDAALAQGRTLTQAQLNAELEQVMGVAPREVPDAGTVATAETDDIVGKGHEVEIHFNPTRFWTVQASFTEKQTINARMAQNVTKYIAERMPHWTTIVDPRTGNLWWHTLYGGSETPFQLFRRTIGNPLQTATATEGLARPQLRRYGAKVSTNFRLSGITEHTQLSRFNIGGALRYESKGAIGYWGLQELPAIITDFDISRPIWDKGHLYADAFIGYRTRLWSDKIGATFQLNVRNLQESGRLQPIHAGPEGKLSRFRIISPRQFILSATFDL